MGLSQIQTWQVLWQNIEHESTLWGEKKSWKKMCQMLLLYEKSIYEFLVNLVLLANFMCFLPSYKRFVWQKIRAGMQSVDLGFPHALQKSHACRWILLCLYVGCKELSQKTALTGRCFSERLHTSQSGHQFYWTGNFGQIPSSTFVFWFEAIAQFWRTISLIVPLYQFDLQSSFVARVRFLSEEFKLESLF